MRTGRSVRPLLAGMAVLLTLVSSLMVAVPGVRADPGTQSDLYDVNTGDKKGRFIISFTDSGNGKIVAPVEVNVHDLEPNTTYQVWRALDFCPDGIYEPNCPDGGVPFGIRATITTSAGGAGTAHFIGGQGLPSGLVFDLVIQIRRDDGVTVVLESNVMTVTVK